MGVPRDAQITKQILPDSESIEKDPILRLYQRLGQQFNEFDHFHVSGGDGGGADGGCATGGDTHQFSGEVLDIGNLDVKDLNLRLMRNGVINLFKNQHIRSLVVEKHIIMVGKQDSFPRILDIIR